MSYYYGGFAPYVSVAERRRKAERALAKLRKNGHPVSPVTIAGRLIATTFWGKAWCTNIEGYHDYETRLPRGRTYVRNGSVVDLQIAPGQVTATVSGSELYGVTSTIKETAQAAWKSICADCAGNIDSMVELLQGRFSKGVMERLCQQQGGLFPRPSDIKFSCSCPDHALMCKHVAAVLYGVGARLDQQPELLFRLRAVNEADLLARIDTTTMLLPDQSPDSSRILAADDVSALFGLDMQAPEEPTPTSSPRSRAPTQKRTAAVNPTPASRRKAPKSTNAASARPVRPNARQEKSMVGATGTTGSAPKRSVTSAASTPARPAAADKQATTARTVATKSLQPATAPSGGTVQKASSISSATKSTRAETTRAQEAGASSRRASSAAGMTTKATLKRTYTRARTNAVKKVTKSS